MIAIGWLSAAGPPGAAVSALPKVQSKAQPAFAEIEEIVTSRCGMCHASEPVWGSIVAAPKALLLDRPEHILRNAKLIGRFAAWSNAMPPGNVTEMTDQERASIAAWLAAGAGGN